ncbi:MAG: class I SAM-dependent methyltransferase [Chitinophagaceae bacterium]
MAKDLFSKQAAEYARSRPGYPHEFIEYIISFAHDRDIAWDCATGNGQAAQLIATQFDQVFATDLSAEQLKHAKPHPKVIYSQSPAEHTGFADNSFDLVTVAQAYHWFDQPAFCREAKRVCRQGALVAVWCYSMCIARDEAVDELLQSFYLETGPYWDEARKQIDNEYRDVYFDFKEIPAEKKFFIHCQWTIDALEGYLNSWSATQKYIAVHGHNPIDAFIEQLRPFWKTETIVFEFPLFLRMGRV